MTFSNPFKKKHTQIDTSGIIVEDSITFTDNNTFTNTTSVDINGYVTVIASGTDGSAGISTGSYPDIWPIPKYYCRVCGEKNEELTPGHHKTIPTLCISCDEKFVQGVLEKMIPLSSKVHCNQCRSHIKACICSTKNALENLKK